LSGIPTYITIELSYGNMLGAEVLQYNIFSPADKPGTVEVSFDLLVGADGVNSAVRSEMIRLTAEDSLQPSILK
jgi:hypothetical protein